MLKRISAISLSVFALVGLAGAPAASAASGSAAGGCVSLHINVNGTDLVNQDFCTP